MGIPADTCKCRPLLKHTHTHAHAHSHAHAHTHTHTTHTHTHTHTHTVPSGPPSNVRVQVLTSSVIQVTWSEVPVREQRGTITNYEVEYKQDAFSDGSVQSVNVAAPTLMVNLTLLHEYTEYLIRVRAYTSVGSGPYSNEIPATTLEDRECTIKYNICAYIRNVMHFG